MPSHRVGTAAQPSPDAVGDCDLGVEEDNSAYVDRWMSLISNALNIVIHGSNAHHIIFSLWKFLTAIELLYV